MKKYLRVTGLLVALAACSGPEETYQVREQALNEAVYASGQIMPETYYFLEANAAERIMKLLVAEGDTVNSGSVLAVLGTPSENQQLDLLTRQVALSRQMAGNQSAVLDELRMKAQLAREQYVQDSINNVRYQELAAQKAVSVREAEQVRLQAESSRTEYMALQQQYASRKNELTRNVLQAEQQLAQLRQSREGKILESPIKGKVFQLYHKEGNLVQPGEPVALVGKADQFKLELLVDERDISKVKVGQKIYFQTEVHPEKQFEARVTKIVPVLQLETRSFEVEADVLSREASALYPQSSVEANIIIRENVEVPVIPTDYILPGDTVLVKQGDEVQKINVQTGTRNGQWVEVRRGLKPGDVLAKNE